MINFCNPNTQKAEPEDSARSRATGAVQGVQGQPGRHSENLPQKIKK